MDSNNKASSADSVPAFAFLHNSWTVNILFLAFLAGLVFILYSSNLDGPFIFDDSRIQNNPQVQVTELSIASLIKAGFESAPRTRPLSHISFAINYYFHGFDTRGYHIFNIAIHVITGFFLYLFFATTLNLPVLQKRYGNYTLIPFAAALIWAVHPVQTQSVTYIIQRMNSMAAMFYILSLYLYVRARISSQNMRKWALFLGAALSGILAMGSKETAATLPFFIFLYKWFFFQDMNYSWLKSQIIPAVIILFCVVFLALLYLEFNPLDRIMGGYAIREFTPYQRLLTELRVVVFYISLLLFPHPARLNLDHHMAFSTGLFSPVSTLMSAAILLFLFIAALASAKKNRLISYCILWFLGNLVIESSVIGLELIFEHRNYLPSMMVVLLLLVLLWPVLRRASIKTAFLCIILSLLSFWTFERNRVWNDRISLWGDSAAKSPAKARPHNNLGVALKAKGQLDQAVFHFQKTIQLDPEFAEAYYNLGNTYVLLGNNEAAIAHYRMALDIVPYNAMVHASLGNVLFNSLKLEEALLHYAEAVRLNPKDINAQVNLASVQQMIRARNAWKKRSGNPQSPLKIQD